MHVKNCFIKYIHILFHCFIRNYSEPVDRETTYTDDGERIYLVTITVTGALEYHSKEVSSHWSKFWDVSGLVQSLLLVQ